jgi:hypothetical protein
VLTGTEIPPATPFEQFVAYLVLSAIAATLISFALPRPLFCKLFKIAFPFMPERLEDFDGKDLWQPANQKGAG